MAIFTFDAVNRDGRSYFTLKMNSTEYNRDARSNFIRRATFLSLDKGGFPPGLRDYIAATPAHAAILKHDYADCEWTPACRKMIEKLTATKRSIHAALPSPADFKGKLMDHQLTAARLILTHEKILGALEQGLGKTILSIYCALAWKATGRVKRCLVVVPANLRTTTWEKELGRFCGARWQIAGGNAESRRAVYSSDAFIVVASYEAVRADTEALKAAGFDAFILDEPGKVKNMLTQTYQALRQVTQEPKCMLELNGTPRENSDDDLFAQLRLFRPDLRYIEYAQVLRYTGAARVAALRGLLGESVFYMSKEDVLGDRRVPVTLEYRALTLSLKQRAAYDRLNGGMPLAQMVRRAQTVNALELVGINDPDNPKLRDALSLHASSKKRGHKLLIYTQFERMAALMAQRIGSGAAIFSGKVNDRDRRELVRRFENDPTLTTLVITSAGERGLDFPFVNTILLYDTVWNPARVDQIIGRADRVVRTQPLSVIVFVSEETFEGGQQRTVAHRRQTNQTLKEALSVSTDHR